MATAILYRKEHAKPLGFEIHPSLTYDRVAEAAERNRLTLDDPGFCISCGAEAMGCEPDALQYKCENCGEDEVYGADELLFGMTPD